MNPLIHFSPWYTPKEYKYLFIGYVNPVEHRSASNTSFVPKCSEENKPAFEIENIGCSSNVQQKGIHTLQ